MITKPRELNVAIVDDDDSLCRSMARLIRASGMSPAIFCSAEEFLDDERHERFDCLILDIQLGGMSGIELCEHLTHAGAGLPVIFLTAHAEPEKRVQGERAGSAAFLAKTEPAERLLAAINEAIDARSSHTTGG